MKRGIAIALGVVLLVIGGPWIGFRLWLSQAPPETRSGIAPMSFGEFLIVARDYYFPRPLDDNAAFGRVEYPGRGHSPWVMRSSLDGRPRMLSLALAPGLWLAYSTESASIHQLWRGDIDFAGPPFDGRHGFEPMSRGSAFLRPPHATAWRLRRDGVWHPARPKWRGHGFDPRGDGHSPAAWLRFELTDAAGQGVTLVERPEWVEAGVRRGLERRFLIEGSGTREVGLMLGAEVGELETRGARLTQAGLLVLEGPEARIVHWLGEPSIAIEPESVPELERDALASFDCSTCHNARERIVGPAWGEIALRYQGADREATAAQLATRIVEGSTGRWGSVPMTPHPDLSRDDALALAAFVLDTEPLDPPSPEVEDADGAVPWTYDFDTEPRPDTLHPSLSASPIDVEGFTPQVGGLAWLPDGRLVVATWDQDGSVFTVEGWGGAASGLRVERIAEGLHEPLGIAVVDGDLYVMQKQEITQLIDHDRDGRIDEYRVLSNDWQATSNFHEFGFGLVPLDGALYAALSVCVLNGGKSCREQRPDRGKVIRVSLETGEVEFVASGLRTPNGLAAMPGGRLLVSDNQGDWLPACKLMSIEPGDDYGWRPQGTQPDPAEVTPPALWLPQNEIGNSPTQPLVLTKGPYAGHVLFGDVYNGGIKRAYLEEVGGRLQGAAFHFTGGLQSAVNRLVEAPDGRVVAGQVGSRGNWGEVGKQWFGLEVLRFSDEPAFEPLKVEARPGGFDLSFGQPLARDSALSSGLFRLQQWYYVPSEIYGGPKYDVTDLAVRDVRLSKDRRVISIDAEGLAAGRVVYIHMDRGLRSERGEALWVNEAWYTMNSLPEVSSGAAAEPANVLSEAERAEGWRLLFDGHSFEGWKNYGAAGDAVEGWVIEDGALEFTRDVSFAGLVWNHVNPFSPAALDLMTEERFGDFELSIDWKVAPGGNSGIFYAVPDERAALSWTYGLEMQVLDDERHSDGQLDKRRAGDLYDVVASAQRVVRPAGEWNRARIRVRGPRVEHWLNGEKVVDITRGSEAWDRAIASSKHADVDGFGLARRGHLVLQDHGDVVWYRNIKLRDLTQ